MMKAEGGLVIEMPPTAPFAELNEHWARVTELLRDSCLLQTEIFSSPENKPF